MPVSSLRQGRAELRVLSAFADGFFFYTPARGQDVSCGIIFDFPVFSLESLDPWSDL